MTTSESRFCVGIDDSLNQDPRSQLIAAAKYFYQQGWMLGTAGNLSARLDDGSFWITASGKDKSVLDVSNFVRVYPSGNSYQPVPESKPSAETSIHQIIYQLFPDARACYHVHSVEANLVSRFVDTDQILLPNLEMLKGLGVWSENPNCYLPLFPNHFHVTKIAADILERFTKESAMLPALLIRDHGITVWANSPATARNYVEVMEYILRFMVSARQMGIDY